MGSSRLPGKVLLEIQGKSVLWHIINRLKYSNLIDKVVIATSNNKKDKAIEYFARKNKIGFYAGSELDLVDRLYKTAKKFGGKYLVRITADCPLVDPLIVDKAILYFKKHKGKLDYVSNITERTYPDGLDVEVFSFKSLEKVWNEVKDPFRREWITSNFYENPHIYKLGIVKNEKNLSHLRWTIDFMEDFSFVEEIYKNLYKKDKVFHMKEILELLKKNPEIGYINVQYTKKYSGDSGYKNALKQRK